MDGHIWNRRIKNSEKERSKEMNLGGLLVSKFNFWCKFLDVADRDVHFESKTRLSTLEPIRTQSIIAILYDFYTTKNKLLAISCSHRGFC